MGVLVDGGDRTAIKRTAEFFLKSFGERLEEQRLERLANPNGQAEFKPQRDKDTSKAKRKEVRGSAVSSRYSIIGIISLYQSVTYLHPLPLSFECTSLQHHLDCLSLSSLGCILQPVFFALIPRAVQAADSLEDLGLSMCPLYYIVCHCVCPAIMTHERMP